MMQRGDIHYIMAGSYTGSEQKAGRPAVIVSNNTGNATGKVVEVVFLTTRLKNDMPTHVTVRGATQVSTALCEQITTISIERVGDYVGKCSETEMQLIDQALCISLNLTIAKNDTVKSAESTKLLEDLRYQIRTLTDERDMYKTMYDKLIDSILNRRD